MKTQNPRYCKKCGNQFRSSMQKKVCYPCQLADKRQRREERAKKKLERKLNSKRFRAREWKRLHKEAWRVFSLYIRTKNANSANLLGCYTCGKILLWREAQAGHLHHNKLDFDERNIHAQCGGCNKYLHGNLAKYATKLVKELGVEGMQKLELDSNTVKYSKEDLEQIIDKYQKLNNPKQNVI